MLADVVARRVKCSGPVAVIHPAPGSCTPERDAARSPAAPELTDENAKLARKDSGPVLLTDPHAHYRAQEEQRTQYPNSTVPTSMARPSTPSVDANADAANGALPQEQLSTVSTSASHSRTSGKPSLVPQEQLRECGRRRIREVDTAGVNDALRILDAQFGKHV